MSTSNHADHAALPCGPGRDLSGRGSTRRSRAFRNSYPVPLLAAVGVGDRVLSVLGWVLAVTFGIYVVGGISGAHLNPAVTLAFAVRRRFPWIKVAPYMAAQVIGAFAGAALVYAVYHDAISALDQALKGPKTNGHTLATLSIFSTFPAPYFQGGIWGPFPIRSSARPSCSCS